jgi:MFS superfamily sulfate permease-like transporter
VVTGLILILACAFLSPHLAFIPTASLSAVIITAIFFTINFTIPLELWRSKRKAS